VSDPIIRPLLASDVPRAAEFCAEAFRDDAAMFARILSANWDPDRPERGALLVDGDTIVGVVISLYSRRLIKGKELRFCALGPWYVRPDYRGGSFKLLSHVLSQKGYTFVSHSPNGISVAVLRRLRFHELSPGWRVFPPLTNMLSIGSIHCHALTDPQKIRPRLGPMESRIYEDHSIHGCGHCLLICGDSSCLVVTKPRTLRGVPVSEILHIGNRELAARCFERLKWAIMRVDRTMMVICDPRLLGTPSPVSVIHRQRLRMFRSDELRADEIDNLYSEVAVM
jgi:hypothetical protein